MLPMVLKEPGKSCFKAIMSQTTAVEGGCHFQCFGFKG